MRKLLLFILLSIALTLTLNAFRIFNNGVGFLIFLLMFISVSGLITIPLGLYRLIKKRQLSNRLIILIGLSLGFFIGMAVQRPIDNWDKQQQNISGIILSAELEKYKEEKGDYPDKIKELDIERIEEILPMNYKTKRFNYEIIDGEYYLYIPLLFLDKVLWNKEKKEFEYKD